MTDVEVTGRRPRLRAAMPSAIAAVAHVLRRQWGLVLLLLAAVALRSLALAAVYPGIWFSDSNGYIRTAATGTLNTLRVSGYSLFVWPFWEVGSAAALIVTQHVIGLAMVVLLYALLRRRGVSRLLACLAVIPAALDAYLLQSEHMIMSETIFHAALISAVALLLWNDRLGPAAAAAAGVLLGYAGVVRSVAVPLIAVVVLYLLARSAGWRAVVALLVGWGVITAGYATIYKVQHGTFGLTQSGGRFLYGKVAPFADCSRLTDLPANERLLCPDPRNPPTTNQAMWGKDSPVRDLPASADATMRDFATRVVLDRPFTYARVVALDFLHYFEPGHRIRRNDPAVGQWQFPTNPDHWGIPGYRGPIRPSESRHARFSPSPYVDRLVDRPRTNAGASRFLHDYQRFAFTTGPILALCVLVVLTALVFRRGTLRLRLDGALLAVSVLTMLLVATSLSVFSYRYGLVTALLLPPAAALAGTALLQPRTRTAKDS